jgi:hypothetical protein
MTSAEIAARRKEAESLVEYLVITLSQAGDVPAVELDEHGADGLDRVRNGYEPGDDPATIWRNNRAYWAIKHKRLIGITHVLFAYDGHIVGAAYLFGSQDARAACQKGKTVLSGSPANSHELIGKPAPVRTKTLKNPIDYRMWSDEREEWVV